MKSKEKVEGARSSTQRRKKALEKEAEVHTCTCRLYGVCVCDMAMCDVCDMAMCDVCDMVMCDVCDMVMCVIL